MVNLVVKGETLRSKGIGFESRYGLIFISFKFYDICFNFHIILSRLVLFQMSLHFTLVIVGM